ncbi:expressed unknown protein [Seminavis robusta]|uniref:Uncharacterized protein n=1 Tax=Seminavis robusta TaxID=568900 RepID=A0A9N8DSX8_9STRA|nr:expressed unknown protein [Seminavis robusta]|eukprot:Sro319_g116350.1 n/a (307) ;mRNA; r:68731-69651
MRIYQSTRRIQSARWLLVALLVLALPLSNGWLLPVPRPSKGIALWCTTPLISSNLGPDENVWKQEGERIITEAAVGAGASPEMLTIEWKSGRVVVTVDALAYISGEADSTLMEDDDIIDDDDMILDEEGDDMIFEEGEDELIDDNQLLDEEEDFLFEDGDLDLEEMGFVEEEGSSSEGVDVVSIARAINAAFEEEGEGSLGFNVAVHHSIEVTTPGATDELSGIMFESYKGFDVILEFHDSKTGKTKKLEGKLIERDDEVTRINERGRMRKFKNELVESVRLPKAKFEKGVGGSNKKKKAKKKKRK